MYRANLLAGVLFLTAFGFAQQPDTSRNPNPDAYTRDTYNRPVEVTHGYGNWGLLGLLGLTGLFGRSRRDTVVRGREERDEYLRRKAS